MKYLLTLFLSLYFILPAAQAQPLAGASNEEQLLAAADSARATYNWSVALDNYKEAYDKNEEEYLLPLVAQMNYELRDVAATIRDYRRVFRRIEGVDSSYNEHRFYYGRALKMDEQYDEALTYLTDFLTHNEDPVREQLARMEIEGIKLYRDAPRETSEVSLQYLDGRINGMWSEYSPVLGPDLKTLYFGTVTSNSAVELVDGDDDKSLLRIYTSTQDEDGDWSKPEMLGREVNRPGVHSANPTVSSDGRRLIYNRILMNSNRPEQAKIYVSDVEDAGWKSGNPIAGGINSDDYLALQPAVGELFGEEVLFFVSDMDGGVGGYDIYYAPYEGDGRYGSPVNLGETINTVGDDMTPFYNNGTLYFSTDGLPTMGGRDLFFSTWDGSAWSAPENMGPGWNGSYDDQSLSVYGDNSVGFFTSNRPGEGRSVKSKTCCDDIYGFAIPSIYANLVVGVFSEAKEPIMSGTVELQPIEAGEPLGPGSQRSRDDGNRYDFGLTLETQYMVVASSEGYYPDTVEINTLGLTESKEIQQIFFLKPIPVEPEVVPVIDTIEVEEAVALENILYDFDKSNIRPEAEGDLRVLAEIMEQYPEMVIELSSHTDARGKDAYNLSLSKRRADAARRWLIINTDIEATRIKNQGYGETQPVVVGERLASRVEFLGEGDVLTEEYIDALPTEEQRETAHQLNRRTEFKVLEGPDQIIIRRDIIERRLDAPERQNDVKPTQKPVQVKRDTISRFSTLYGRDDVKGLPYFKFDKRQIDLGPVKKGESRKLLFAFTNVSEVPAKIMLTQACECTTIEHDDSKVYAPGQTGILKVTFDSSEKDAAETITIDIFLEQEDPDGRPIVEMVEYSFDIIK